MDQPTAQYLSSLAAAGDAEALGSALASAEAAGCPQAELEAAKAELKALRRRDCLAVVLRGATGPKASFINGTYSPTNEKANGAPVYVKVEDPAWCLYRATNGCWFATSVAKKDANKSKDLGKGKGKEKGKGKDFGKGREKGK